MTTSRAGLATAEAGWGLFRKGPPSEEPIKGKRRALGGRGRSAAALAAVTAGAGRPRYPERAGSIDLPGADAATVVRELAQNNWERSHSEAMRQLPDGTRIGVRWRYLLPSE
jgi:hypothetical protein